MARKTKRSGRPQAHSIVVGNDTEIPIEDAQSSDSDGYGSDDDFYYSKRLDPFEDELYVQHLLLGTLTFFCPL